MKNMKLGSVKSLKKSQKVSFLDRIWDYKIYLLLGLVVFVILYMFSLGYRRMMTSGSADVNPSSSSTTVKDEVSEGTGKLVVNTDPPGSYVNFRGEDKKAPAVFMKIPDGEFILTVHAFKHRTVTQPVVVEDGKTQTVTVKLEKLNN
jgi:zona occludens toxin (predicted ATPase)